jgi:hypothetical protein
MARYTITLTESAEATILKYLKSVAGVKKVERIEESRIGVPAWHDDEVALRLKEYMDNPNDVVDFDSTLKKLEKEL